MKPSIPQGTRDFSADVVRKRSYIFNIIRHVFELYGFQPLETPAMENLETLLGKYGDEGDKLIFKILNNGISDPKNVEKSKAAFENILAGKNDKNLTERALKYDLTIPFARYVAMNHGQISFPFKRYQMQPVWRADRPQKGRYREFYQCDADVVGSQSLLNEVELVNIYIDVFSQLKIEKFELRINSRKVLAALAEVCGGADKMIDITVTIDKLDKIGIENVKEELAQRGLNENQVSIINEYLNINGSNEEKLIAIKNLLAHSETGKKGIEEIEVVWSMVTKQRKGSDGKDEELHIHYSPLIIDFTLARGLNYYTGIILEAKAPAQVKMGSIGGGGRYDDLTGLFGVPNIPGVGISFGVDRIYDVMEELQLFPETISEGTKVLFFNLGEEESIKAYELVQLLRKANIASEIYHEQAKFDKQFKYAEKKNIPYIAIVGSKELQEKTAMIKNLSTGHQQPVSFETMPAFFKNNAS